MLYPEVVLRESDIALSSLGPVEQKNSLTSSTTFPVYSVKVARFPRTLCSTARDIERKMASCGAKMQNFERPRLSR